MFIEEPEAHTHPQLQYIFARKINEIISDISGIQTIISTHSPHIVSNHPFENIRYLSTSKNEEGYFNVDIKNFYKDLSEKYATELEEFQFLQQYLSIESAELFFADKAIFIEGVSEKILLQHFMSEFDNEKIKEEEDANKLRFDDIVQSVAMKRLAEGNYENSDDRHGFTKILYTVTDKKPNAFSPVEDKEKYQNLINKLLLKAQEEVSDSKILILTNKAIAEKNGFQHLYKIFDDRYIDISDRIENYLRSIQALDVSDLCHLYIKKDYNALIKLVRKGGYVIHSIADKQQLHDIIDEIINDQNLSVSEVVEKAIKYKLLKRTEKFRNIAASNTNFINQLNSDTTYQLFKKFYLEDQNTFKKIKDSIDLNSEEEFDYYQQLFKRERFIVELFSSDLKFSEVFNFTKYLNEETEYITMHKTKGTSIPSVIVVMEEFFWNEYDFSLLYKNVDDSRCEKAIRSQKLIYVACSRAKHNLICTKVLTMEEVPDFLKYFPDAEFVDIRVENKK